MQRFVASSVQHWQFPTGWIRKSRADLNDLKEFLRGGAKTQVHDGVTATALSDVVSFSIPQAKKKVHFAVGDEIIVAEVYVDVQDAQGKTGRRTFHTEEGVILNAEERAKLKLDYWKYQIVDQQGASH